MSKYLSSPKLAGALILTLLFLVFLSSIIPQQGYVENKKFLLWQHNDNGLANILEFLQFTKIYKSFWFLTLSCLLFTNNFLCLIKRTKSLERITFKNLGTLLFHSSLLIIFLGILINSIFGMHAVIALTEGQELIISEKNLHNVSKGIFFKDASNKFKVKLLDYMKNYKVKNTSTAAARIKIVNMTDIENSKEKTIYPNNPMNHNHYNIYLGNNDGFSPLVYIKNKNINFKKYVRMANTSRKGISQDYFEIDNFRVGLKLEVNSSSNTVLKVKITEKIPSSNSRKSWFGNVHSLSLKYRESKKTKNWQVGFLGMRKWSLLEISKNHGTGIIFLGFFLGIIGLGLKYVFN